MKIIAACLVLAVSVVSLFAQQPDYINFELEYLKTQTATTTSLDSCNLTPKINFQENKSLMFAPHATYHSSRSINMAHINNCPGTIAPPFVFIGGLYAGYLAYDSFKHNETKDAYTFLGISTVLITAPVIYIVYCSRHKYSSNKNKYHTKKQWI